MSYLSSDCLDVIQQVLNEACPPTNPSVLLEAARAWYLEKGNDAVLRSIVSWLSQVIGTSRYDVESLQSGRDIFERYLADRT